MTGVEHYFAKFQAVTVMNMKKTAIFWHEDIPEDEGSVFIRSIDKFLSYSIVPHPVYYYLRAQF
jgi:hypothetical protein